MMNIIWIFAATLLLSCSDQAESGCALVEQYTDSFVLSYQDITSLGAYVKPDNSIWIYGNELVPDGYTSALVAPQRFGLLCEKHGDTGYARTIEYLQGTRQNYYVSSDFVRVEIISDSDFDGTHPAGSNLSDVVRFMALSPYAHIKSRYTEIFDWENYAELNAFQAIFYQVLSFSVDRPDVHFSRGRGNLFPIDKIAASLTQDDLTLLGGGLYVPLNARPVSEPMAALQFVAAPVLSKEHRMTIRFVADDGREYVSNQVTIMF